MKNKQNMAMKSDAEEIFACENNILQYIVKPDARLLD